MPTNPAELASLRAEASIASSFELTPEDELLLAELDHGAESLGFHNQTYFVEAFRGLVVPASFEAADRVTYVNFMGITLEGRFATFSKVHIGTIVGAGAVRAVCLTFTDVTLLPYFDTLAEDDLLHVPVLSVAQMSKTSQ